MDTEEEIPSGKVNNCPRVLDSHGVDGCVSHHSGGCTPDKLAIGSVNADHRLGLRAMGSSCQ